MLKYAKLINEETKEVSIANTGTKWVKSQGYTTQEVEQSDIDSKWYLLGYAPMKTDEEKAEEEAQRIAMLNLTGADVERGIYKAKGMDFDDIIAYLEAQPLSEDGQAVVDIKALKIELKANNFYRGNPYVEQIGKILGFTDEQLTKFFETGDYKELITANQDD